MKTKPIHDTYWVIPGKLLAGEYPALGNEREARGKLRWLMEQGVTAWVDLTQEGEDDLTPYEEWLEEEAESLGMSVSHMRLEIEDFCTPTVEHMRRILNRLDGLLEEGQTVYLHCFGGIGRTGMTVGCYLVRHGIGAQAALKQIADWRRGLSSSWRRSPETDEQVRFVLTWG